MQGQAGEVVQPYLERAHRAAPQNRKYTDVLAGRYIEAQDYRQAAEIYEQILQRRPDDVMAMGNCAFVYYQAKRDTDEALKLCRRAVELRPDVARFRHTLGLLLVQTGQDSEALRHLREAVKLEPDNARAHYDLAITLHATGDVGGAVASLERAITLSGDPSPQWLPDARARLAQLRRP